MKSITTIALLVGLASLAFFALNSEGDAEAERQFQDFIAAYGPNYATEAEYQFRFGVFQNTLKEIEEARILNPKATFGVDLFADQTDEEMEKRMGYFPSLDDSKPEAAELEDASLKDITVETVDFSYLYDGVKNQGWCGSCWAFSTVGAIEGRNALHQGLDKIQTYYSEQQAVDCDGRSWGCRGGSPTYAFMYFVNEFACTAEDYPYKARNGECKASSCTNTLSLSKFNWGGWHNEAEMKKHIQGGPMSVTHQTSWGKGYKDGLLENCNKGPINHATLLVGYNATENSWKIKNSWGAGWGNKGYMKFRADVNACHIWEKPQYPVFE